MDNVKVKAAPAVPSDHDQDSSADSEFAEERKPARPSRIIKRKASEVVDDANTSCSICTRPWHSSGDHRICCLKCGHLFGKSCIRKWIELRSCCPECQKRARLTDITVLFTSKFAVKDTNEIHDLAIIVEQEKALRRRAESELTNLRQKYGRLHERFTQLRSSLAEADAPFIAAESIAVTNSRVLHADGSSLLVSCTSDHANQFGYRRFSLLDLHSHNRFLPLHQGEIRDLDSNGDGLVASASLDKHLKVSSLKTETCIADFDTALPVWSCCFMDPFVTLTGTANGQIIAFDLRRPNAALSKISIRTPRPISTVRMLDSTRIVCAGPGHAAVACLEPDLSVSSYIDLPIDEKRCIGASVASDASSILVSLRSEQRPYATHAAIDVKSLAVEAETSPYSTGLTLGRAIMFRHGDERWIASGDQETQSAWLWNASSPDRNIQLQLQQNGVVNMLYTNGIVASLSNTTLNLYKARG